MINKTVLLVERDPAEAKKILDFFKSNKFRNKIEAVHFRRSLSVYGDEVGGTVKDDSKK